MENNNQRKKGKDDGSNVSLSGYTKQLRGKNNKDEQMPVSVDNHADAFINKPKKEEFGVERMEAILNSGMDEAEEIIEEKIDAKLDKEFHKDELRKLFRLNPQFERILKSKKSPKQALSELFSLIKQAREGKLTEELISLYAYDLIEYMMECIQKDDLTTKDKMVAADKMLKHFADYKKSFWPATQKNLNLNIDLFEDKLAAWRNAREETIFEVIPDDKK